jgi:hypothetical protein
VNKETVECDDDEVNDGQRDDDGDDTIAAFDGEKDKKSVKDDERGNHRETVERP